jgi:hypothetical protein
VAQEDDRRHDQPADVPSPADDNEPIFEEIDDDTKAVIIAPAPRPTSASGGPQSRVMTREERLRLLGPGWEDVTDEAVEKGLAFIIPCLARGPLRYGRWASRSRCATPTHRKSRGH